MAENEGEYKKILTEVIQKQMAVFGPKIALDKARKVAGLTIGDNGAVLEMNGNFQMLFKVLSHEYSSLSAETFKMSLAPLVAKYPAIKFP